MTSANPSGEPLVIHTKEACERLNGIADAILTHDREIVCRCDDSVVRVVDGAARLVRRARGYTPLAVKTHCDMTGIAATGASLKATAALGRGQEVFVTAHIGDTKNVASCNALKDALLHFEDILETHPTQAVACDLHPDFTLRVWLEKSPPSERLPCSKSSITTPTRWRLPLSMDSKATSTACRSTA